MRPAEADRQLDLFSSGPLTRFSAALAQAPDCCTWPKRSAPAWLGSDRAVQMAGQTIPNRRKYSRIATDQVISFAPVDDSRDLLGVSRERLARRHPLRGRRLRDRPRRRPARHLQRRRPHRGRGGAGEVWATEIDPDHHGRRDRVSRDRPERARSCSRTSSPTAESACSPPARPLGPLLRHPIPAVSSTVPAHVRLSSEWGDHHPPPTWVESGVERLERELLSVQPCAPDRVGAAVSASPSSTGDGLKGIVDVLRNVDVSAAGRCQYLGHRRARRATTRCATSSTGSRRSTGEAPTLLWNSGPRVESLYERLRGEGLDPGEDGKGRSTWLAYGYVLATGVSRVIAVHDCDIRTTAASCWRACATRPANPNLQYEFAKGYYGRVTDRLHGRVTRLFVTPAAAGPARRCSARVPLLDYLDSFRYPLAGECSMTTDLARINRIPERLGPRGGHAGRGLSQLLAQADLPGRAGRELRPQAPGPLGGRRSTRGLHRMVVDIAAPPLIRNLASYGVEFDAGFLNTLTAAYLRTAQDAIASYSDDAALERSRLRSPRRGGRGGDIHRARCARRGWDSCASRWGTTRFPTGTGSRRPFRAFSTGSGRRLKPMMPSSPSGRSTRSVASH